MRALERDGSQEAAEVLGQRPCWDNATRCQDCPGCTIMNHEGACQICPGCKSKSGCQEYNHLCFSWDRATRNYHNGMATTGVSSHFEVATVDLSKYMMIVEEIKAGCLDLDLALDTLPADHPHHANARYSQERLNRDMTNEETHLSHLEEMLHEHRAHRECLDKVDAKQFRFGEDDVSTQNPWLPLTNTAAAQGLEKALQTLNLSPPTGDAIGLESLEKDTKAETLAKQDGNIVVASNNLKIVPEKNVDALLTNKEVGMGGHRVADV